MIQELFVGMVSLVIKRYEEVKRMKNWVTTDRSDMRMDAYAISSD